MGETKKSSKLRQLLNSYNKLTFMMEAHSGHSAKIVEETGFQCIWASGLSISASIGVRDANEASLTEVVQVVDYINQATNIPVLMDGDTGFGNFNNARRLVSRLEQLGIAGVCFEDKLFPKTNSFIVKDHGPQPLAPVEEFVLKIAACKQVQKDPDFCVIARVEALISDHSMDEALYRAEEYRKAGADAILIHSKRSNGNEIREFLTRWKQRHPIIIVPTTYHQDITEDEMRHLGVNMIIWANHNIRASTKAMQEVSQEIFKSRGVKSIEPNIASVREIFRLQKEEELARDEKKFLPKTNTNVNTPGSNNIDHTYNNHIYRPKGISAIGLVDYMKELNIKFVVGVPDSLLDPFIKCLPLANEYNSSSNSNLFHHIAANEGSALAIAAGYQVASSSSSPLGVKPPLVYIQNSGLGNLINVLLSLTHREVYSIPCVIMVGWRGDPSLYQKRDEPQHRVQGECMLDLLKSMSMEAFILPNDSDTQAHYVISQAYTRCIEIQQPVFIIVRPDTFSSSASSTTPSNNVINNNNNKINHSSSLVPLVNRRDALSIIDECTSSNSWMATVGSTGKLSREIYEIRQEKQKELKHSNISDALGKYFLMVGSMGHALSFSAGLSFSGLKGNICCIDGDGSLLMHAGSLVTINSLPNQSRLLHISLNNKLHESVGLQPTATIYPSVSLSGIAKNMGYSRVKCVTTIDEAKQFIKEFELTASNNHNNTSNLSEGEDQSDSRGKAVCWFMEWVISPTPPENTKSLARPKESPLQRKKNFMVHIANVSTNQVH